MAAEPRGITALAALFVFVALAAGMYAFLVRKGLRRALGSRRGLRGTRMIRETSRRATPAVDRPP
jgi:hypothetical protein